MGIVTAGDGANANPADAPEVRRHQPVQRVLPIIRCRNAGQHACHGEIAERFRDGIGIAQPVRAQHQPRRLDDRAVGRAADRRSCPVTLDS